LSANAAGALAELEAVNWRPRIDARRLRMFGWLWTGWVVLWALPFVAVAVLLVALEPWTAPMAALALAHAWMVPVIHAQRGSNVLRPAPYRGGAEDVAQGFLGDLLGHDARELQRSTGLAMERGRLGVWLLGEQGAALVAPGGRRVHGFCVKVPDPELPPSDRIAHLLLALRTDEAGFATVANHAFSGSAWRLRRRLPAPMRPALDAAVRAAR
jgi:hypothetical protein